MATELKEARIRVKLDIEEAEKSADSLEKKTVKTRERQRESEREDRRRDRDRGGRGGGGGVGPALAGGGAARLGGALAKLGLVVAGVAGGMQALDTATPRVRGLVEGLGGDPAAAEALIPPTSLLFLVDKGLKELTGKGVLENFRDLKDAIAGTKESLSETKEIALSAMVTGGGMTPDEVLGSTIDSARIAAFLRRAARARANIRTELEARSVGDFIKRALPGSAGK